MTKITEIETPCVVIDTAKVEANLARAQAHANANGYRLRPHIKTHKLPRFARRQVELGAVGITAQKLGEAEIMAEAGLTDIFLPYNIIGESKLRRLAALNAKVTLSVTADSETAIAGYAGAFSSSSKSLHVLVECDTGGQRCGVQSPAQALALARKIAQSPGLTFGGLMTYPARGKSAEADRWLGEAKALIEAAGIPVPVVTGGNSPDMWHTGDTTITERRPGTYIYFDRSQVAFGVAQWSDCAFTVLTTVVSRPTPSRVIVDAGSKSLSSDLMGQVGYGAILGHEHIAIQSLSEEHGLIELAEPSQWPAIGDRLRIIPNHVCVVSNLFDRVHLIAGDEVVETVPVAARGRVD